MRSKQQLLCLVTIGLSAALSAGEPERALAQELPASISPADLALVKAAENARIQTIERVTGTVVAIYGNDRGGGGSGVLFDSAGFALTNHHVVAAAGAAGWAGLADGKLYRWKLIGTDPGGDLAIIQLAGQPTFPAARLADSAQVRIGDWAMAMGNPFVLAEDQRPSVTLGIVSGINRFQEGSGLNQLVYGNCIQVDSSINPGNSGGPLFNLAGQVIGINGRGSFEERGRVNVGLGYAISSNQIKNFIPELLATKIAQHGTLDAVFGNRDGRVVCHTLNLDSPIARLGMRLGDRLLEFENAPIASGNELMNRISTYPAAWPVSVTFERDGKRVTAHVRLTALPYELRVAPLPENPSEKDKPEQPEKPSMPKQGPPEPELQPPPPSPVLSLAEAGKIRDEEVNQHIAAEIVGRWRQLQRADLKEQSNFWRLASEIRREDQIVGSQELLFASDGRCCADYEIAGDRTRVAFDGKAYWLATDGREKRKVSRAKALRDPHFSQAAVLGALLSEKPFASDGKWSLQGADKAQNRLCYRLALAADQEDEWFVWLSLFDDAGLPRLELQKSGVGIDDDEPIASVLYANWKLTAGLRLPTRRTLVTGLAEQPQAEIVTTAVETPRELDPSLFSLSSEANRNE